MIDAFMLAKWVHLVSSTILFGTGLGTALHMVLAHRSKDVRAIAVVTRNVVNVDWCCTLPSGIVQPASGAALIVLGGHDPTSGWLLAAYALYAIAAICWIIVVVLQRRMAQNAADAARAGKPFLPDRYYRDYRLWFLLGWPAFLGLIAVFGLMVFKPWL
jgi:uncharacterized membrane protein